jgi:hypothetical protein
MAVAGNEKTMAEKTIQYAPTKSDRPTGRENEVRELQEADFREMVEKGEFRFVKCKDPIKLQDGAPRLVIAIPMGNKPLYEMHQCPHCEERQQGHMTCGKCGEEFKLDQPLVTSGMVPAELSMTLAQIQQPMLCKTYICARKGIRSSIARHQMTLWAIEIGAEYIFYLDDDVMIPPSTLTEMYNVMELDKDIAVLSGVYVTKENIPSPLIFKRPGEGAYWDFSAVPGVVEDIYSAGGGCLMARVSAIKESIAAYGHSGWKDVLPDKTGVVGLRGHDIQFMHQIHQLVQDGKASRDWRVCVAGWIQCLHLNVHTQKFHEMPKTAPCFKDVNTAGYWDNMYRAEGNTDIRCNQELFDAIAEEVDHGAEVVDVGCGNGVLLQQLINRKGISGQGIDISGEAIKNLKERFIDGHQIDVGDADAYQFREGTTVTATELLEHLNDTKKEVFLEKCKVAKKCLFSVPEGDLAGTPRGEHVQVYTKESFEKDLLRFFVNVVVKFVGGRLLAICKRG